MSDTEAEGEGAAVDAGDADLTAAAEAYVDAAMACKEMAARVKALKEEKDVAADDLLEAFEEAECDAIKLASGVTVKRFEAKTTEKVDSDFVAAKLTAYLSRNRARAAQAPARVVATEAASYIYDNRQSSTSYRISMRQPPKKKAAKPPAKKARHD